MVKCVETGTNQTVTVVTTGHYSDYRIDCGLVKV